MTYSFVSVLVLTLYFKASEIEHEQWDNILCFTSFTLPFLSHGVSF